MQTTLYVATTNPGKLRDFKVAAGTHDLDLVPLPELGNIPPPPEDEDSFEANARAKAVYYSLAAPGRLVMADDSGLEVDALEGAPGVRSARYAADAGVTDSPGGNSDVWNNIVLLTDLARVPDAARSARYRCVLALARDGHCLLTATGQVEGAILTAPRGTGGFGYDPIFFIPELGKTMAEVDLETKHRLSHRGRAFRALLKELPRMETAPSKHG